MDDPMNEALIARDKSTKSHSVMQDEAVGFGMVISYVPALDLTYSGRTHG